MLLALISTIHCAPVFGVDSNSKGEFNEDERMRQKIADSERGECGKNLYESIDECFKVNSYTKKIDKQLIFIKNYSNFLKSTMEPVKSENKMLDQPQDFSKEDEEKYKNIKECNERIKEHNKEVAKLVDSFVHGVKGKKGIISFFKDFEEALLEDGGSDKLIDIIRNIDANDPVVSLRKIWKLEQESGEEEVKEHCRGILESSINVFFSIYDLEETKIKELREIGKELFTEWQRNE